MKETTQLAAELGRRLQVLNAHVTTAESCTGGGIAEAITRIPGSSAWFEAGYVTYSNRQKTRQLDVPGDLFETVGAMRFTLKFSTSPAVVMKSADKR